MTAIVFNGRDAIKWGTTNIARVYAGAALVWSKAVGLPYANALATVPAGWTTLSGTWTPTTILTQQGIAGNGTVPTRSVHSTISAYNVRVSIHFNVTKSTQSNVSLLARDTPLGTYYLCHYTALGRLELSVNSTILGAWAIPGGPRQGTMELSCIGTTITAKIGAVSHSVTDASIHEAGTVGMEAAVGGWFRDISVTAA